MHYMILAYRPDGPNPEHPEELEKLETAFRLYECNLRDGGHLVASAQFGQASECTRFVWATGGTHRASSHPADRLFGMFLIDVKDRDEADQLASRCPGSPGVTVELRKASAPPAEIR
ncbi:MAG TPA: YciI family protein [Myxococcales bacterium LLY-WYZ-16_1]|nr:YciI family protein [Myxococcales bacterium LLY-WYZ-16_1]